MRKYHRAVVPNPRQNKNADVTSSHGRPMARRMIWLLMPPCAQQRLSSASVKQTIAPWPSISVPVTYMRKVRVRRAANLVLFVVDGSWSMAVAERMTATKGAILSLLTDAYQRRDRVGLIVFQKNRSTTVLPPTNSVIAGAEAPWRIFPVGGKTPLIGGFAGEPMSWCTARKCCTRM